jgi:putative nucleotidyltransferase with HDIG domain
MNIDSKDKASNKQYFPIYLESLRVNTVLDFDLYIERAQDYILFRSARLPFTEKTRQNLLENNISRLFVSVSDNRSYYRHLEATLPDIVQDASIRETRRAGLVYETALFLIKDLFEKPTLGENIKRSQELVEATVRFILGSRTAFMALLDILAFDYTTFSHSVNVCALSLALAQHAGMDNPRDLHALGTGALLHDIGKTRIPETILNKKEPLTPDEIFIIRRHPRWGFDLAKETDQLDPESYYCITQHHERENGSGYPLGIGSKHIHQFGKITAIADAFDAMTTEKTYRPAMEAYPALREMFAEDGAFDHELLEVFTKMLGPEETETQD